ncbi:MAG TPA: BamA/TamA family outer membrane protein [Thermoanaerobaculia bacterium]|nr:BamA/TamA family outer membrane protein [Thermoanaerobaculia bacterium]
MRIRDQRIQRYDIPPSGICIVPAALVMALFVILGASAAEAQYFGRNQVQWEKFDFKVLKTEHFDIHYYPEQEPVIDDVARMSERWYDRLSAAFNHHFERKPIVLYANHPDFQQTTVGGGLIPEGTGGFTDPFKNRVVMPLTQTYGETDHVLGHELVHVFQFDIAEALTSRGQNFRLQMMPLWMIEGLAEYLSQGRVDPQTAMWMRNALLKDELPTLRDLMRDPRLSPYQYGQAFWAYVAGRWGDQAATRLFVAAGVLGIEGGFREVLGTPSEDVFAAWHASIREAYEPVIAARQAPALSGQPILTRETAGGDLNIGPSISPDGTHVAFMSTRDLFTIDLYLADAATGKVLRKLASAAADPHFDAIRFIDSAGSWSPDGRRFAFVVTEKGDNTLAILDVQSNRIERRIEVPTVGAISNPVWSPDGRTIAFSGMSGGVSDIYLIDVESRSVRRLTNDKFADLQPAWSPDGRTIAVASDRGPGTDFGTLSYHPMRISLIDVQSGEVRVLSLFDDAKHINPQYGPDGDSLYFVADMDGVADVFRYSLSRGQIFRVTNVSTGVTGISDLSPAISVASRTGTLMFSVFTDDRWNIHALAPDEATGSRLASLESDIAPAGVLPPAEAEAVSTVASYLDRPTAGLPAPAMDYAVTGYRADLSLDYIGPPAIGVGADRYGYGLGGSVSAYFSDILGRHQVGVALQGGGSSTGGLGTQIGAQLFYLNREHRINWGAQGTHLPFISAQTFAYEDVVEIDGQPTLVGVIEQQRQIVTLDDATLLSHYPLSQTRRIEINGGYSHYGFDAEVERLFILGQTVIGREITDLPTPPSFELYRAAAAYVGDNSYFGFISPVRGWRYRFEVEGNFGDLEFQTGLADYRRYFWMRPVTVAFRGLHLGRYGTDAENDLLYPLFVGRGTLVRGYDLDSFGIEECTSPPGSNACPEFDRMIGSKMAVANFEVRVPLFGFEDYGLIELPYLPTELVAFLDSGVAWTEDQSPELKFEEETTERVPIVSAGISARILLGGYLPLELYFAKPFQRPQEDWVFGFNIAPGW